MTVTRPDHARIPLPVESREDVPEPPREPGWDAFALFSRSPDPFVAVRAVRDAHGRIVDFAAIWANRAGAALIGVPQVVVPGRTWSETFPAPAAGQEVAAALVDAVELDRPLVRVLRFELDGEPRWVRAALTPMGGDRIAAALLDVTDEHLARARLEESEERFRILVETWAQAVWEADADGLQEASSDSWTAYTGQREEDQRGDGWAMAVHPADRDRALAQWRRAVRDGRRFDAVFRLRRGTGWRWTNVRAAPVRDDAGAIRRWIGMNVDVTAAREARDELRRSEERLRLAMAVAGFATFDRDPRTGRTVWSPTLARIVGSPEGVVPDGLRGYVHPDDAPAVATAEAETLESDHPYRYEHRIVTPAGEVRWVGVHGQTLFERVEGVRRPIRSLGVVVDLTEQRRAGELRDVFVGMLSHELRTPVTAVYGGAQMLLRHRLPEETREEIVADIATESDRMRRLVENLLVLAKVERRAEVGVPLPVPLHPIVERAVADERRRWPTARIDVETERGLPAVLGDEAAVELAVVNLVSNALKYGRPDGRVLVRLGREGDEVAIRVLDDGNGLPPEPERLFELFYRTDVARRSASGAGIGLYVARALVEGVGGRIWARNRPEGSGAEFGIALPVVPEPEDGGA